MLNLSCRHEHLYRKISKNIIQSDEFSSAAKQLGDCQVILCTLSMLSNHRISLFTHQIPITSLVVDEASQIALSDFVLPLSSARNLCKLTFIGDEKQCKCILLYLLQIFLLIYIIY